MQRLAARPSTATGAVGRSTEGVVDGCCYASRVPSALPFVALLDDAWSSLPSRPVKNRVEPTLHDLRPPPSSECEPTVPRTPPPADPAKRVDRARRIFAGALEKKRAGDADAALDALLAAAIDPRYRPHAQRWTKRTSGRGGPTG